MKDSNGMIDIKQLMMRRRHRVYNLQSEVDDSFVADSSEYDTTPASGKSKVKGKISLGQDRYGVKSKTSRHMSSSAGLKLNGRRKRSLCDSEDSDQIDGEENDDECGEEVEEELGEEYSDLGDETEFSEEQEEVDKSANKIDNCLS